MTADVTVDPTVANELAELQAMVNENPSPQETAAAENAEEAGERKKQRAISYCEKIHPFVAAWGSRWKRPLTEQEAVAFTKALADVGVEIIPETGNGEPPGPWTNLMVVTIGIALPRVVGAWSDRRKGAPERNDQATPQAAPTKTKTTGDVMLDGARDFDAKQNKPH